MWPTTPLLGLQLPPPGTAPGPEWADAINYNFNLLDALGNPINSSEFVVDSNVNFNGYSPFNQYSSQLASQGSASSSIINGLQCVNGNLVWINSTGFAVGLTNGNSPSGAVGNIGGLPDGSAGIAWNHSQSAFIFTAYDGAHRAGIYSGPISLFDTINSTPASNSVNLLSPQSLAASYNWLFPTTTPASVPQAPARIQISTAGQLSYSAADAVSGGTGATPAPITADSMTSIPGLQLTGVVCSGRPVRIRCLSDQTGPSSWKLTNTALTSVGVVAQWQLVITGSASATLGPEMWGVQPLILSAVNEVDQVPGSFSFDWTPNPGTYNFQVQALCYGISPTTGVSPPTSAQLFAYSMKLWIHEE